MLAITGLVTFVLLGGGPATGEPEGQVQVQVRLMEMKDVSWRGAAYHELTPQGRQGPASVWTTDPAGLKILSTQAGTVIQCPKVDAPEGASAQITNQTQHNFVGHMKRVADGPPGENSKVAYEPQIDAIADGITAEFSCRKVEGGTMVRATVVDSHLLGFNTVTFQDSVTDRKTKKKTAVLNPQLQVPEWTTSRVEGEWLVPRGGMLVVGFGPKSTIPHNKGSEARERVVVIEPSWVKAEDVVGQVMIGAQSIPIKGFEPTPLRTRDESVRTARFRMPKPVAVPSVRMDKPIPVSATVLPLLASPTIAPRVGWKATVRIDARMTPPVAADEDAVTVMCLPLSSVPLPIKLSNVWLSASIEPRRAEAAPMAMATPPSRVLPTPIALNGEVVELPPLPDDLVELALAAEATPTPQAKPAPAAGAPRPLLPPDARISQILDQFMSNRQATLNQMVCDEVVIYPAPDSTQVVAASSMASGCEQKAGWQWALAQSSPPSLNVGPGRVDRPSLGLDGDAPRRAPLSQLTKMDSDFLRTYYGGLWRGSDHTPREFVGRPISIELPAAPKKAVRGATLGLQLKTADGECEYDSGISLKAIAAQPVTIRVPMADGTIVEIQAKVVKPAKK